MSELAAGALRRELSGFYGWFIALTRVQIYFRQLPPVFQYKCFRLELSIYGGGGRCLISKAELVMIVRPRNFYASWQPNSACFAEWLLIPVGNIRHQKTLLVKGLKTRQANTTDSIKPEPT